MPAHELSDQEAAARAGAVARRTWTDATVRDVRRLEGGVSSLTYAARLERPGASDDVVLKFAPPGLEPVRNRDVLRQARVLDRLAALEGFPVPAVLMRDPGEPPDVPPMFAMAMCSGQAYEPLLDVAEQPPTAEEVVAREHALARALARLQSRTPADLGTGDEPVMSAADELSRWQRLFGTVDADVAPGHEKLAARLAERVPGGVAPSLLHGDYRAANALFVGTELSAVIDWEIWSVGDPRTDLAWLLLHTGPAHVFHPDRSAADLDAGRLMPSADELLVTYLDSRRASGASEAELVQVTTDLSWFVAVGHYKVASTIAVIWKRERKRAQPDPKLQVAAERLDAVLQAGHAALDQLV